MDNTHPKEKVRYLFDDEITPKSLKEMRQGAIEMPREILAALETDEDIHVAMVVNCSIKERPDLMGSGMIGYTGACRHLAQQLFQLAISLPKDVQWEPEILFERKR